MVLAFRMSLGRQLTTGSSCEQVPAWGRKPRGLWQQERSLDQGRTEKELNSAGEGWKGSVQQMAESHDSWLSRMNLSRGTDSSKKHWKIQISSLAKPLRTALNTAPRTGLPREMLPLLCLDGARSGSCRQTPGVMIDSSKGDTACSSSRPS